MDSYLTADMEEAIMRVGLDDSSAKLIKRMLYAERSKKESVWDNEAVELFEKSY